MLLKSALDLSRSINQCRDQLHKLAKDKGFTDNEVVKLRKQIEVEKMQLQELIAKNFPPGELTFTLNYK